MMTNADDDSSGSQWEDKFSSSGDEYSSSDGEQSSWDSSSSSNSSSSSSGSSESESEDDERSDNDDPLNSNNRDIGTNFILNLKSGIRFRRRKQETVAHHPQSPTSVSDRSETKSHFRSSRTTQQQEPSSAAMLYKKGIRLMLSKKSTVFLTISIFIWLYVQFLISFQGSTNSNEPSTIEDENSLHNMGMGEQNEESAFEALGQAAAPLEKKDKKFKNSRDRHKSGDKLPKGCEAYSWQTYNFPNCNDVHEIDLRHALHISKRGRVIPADLGEGDKSEHKWSKEQKATAKKMGYLGSGLWRQVWKVDPRLKDEDAVLKVMKAEHEIDRRNFDRHRRDSLVMERLTSAPNVVSIYGFCGNTVLTEYAGMTLDDYLYEDVDIAHQYDRSTSKGKIRLALEVMKGVKALHEINDGPIVHADIQAKQFIFDPVEGVKINDFNRCRFLPKNNQTGEACKLRIPSAPGGNRSPEEYEIVKIDEKIDVFSTANVLYGILTGEKPHGKLSRKQIRKNVMNGKKPEIDEEFRKPGTAEAALAELITHAYAFNPKERWSASVIVDRLESILKNETKTSSSLRRRLA